MIDSMKELIVQQTAYLLENKVDICDLPVMAMEDATTGDIDMASISADDITDDTRQFLGLFVVRTMKGGGFRVGRMGGFRSPRNTVIVRRLKRYEYTVCFHSPEKEKDCPHFRDLYE